MNLLFIFCTFSFCRCILDFLISKFNDNSDERLDTTHTPPAPMMTLTQQKIITLISALEKKCNELENISIFEFIFDGINYTLFRLGYAPEVCIFFIHFTKIFLNNYKNFQFQSFQKKIKKVIQL